jgi:hypothetical protein
MQADVLHRRPDNGQTTGLGREGVDLIGALPHVAEETFDRIGRLNVSMHRLRKRKKGEGVLFVLSQTSGVLPLTAVDNSSFSQGDLKVPKEGETSHSLLE